MAEDGAHHPPSVLVLPVLRVYGPQDNGGAGPPEPRIVNDSVGRAEPEVTGAQHGGEDAPGSAHLEVEVRPREVRDAAVIVGVNADLVAVFRHAPDKGLLTLDAVAHQDIVQANSNFSSKELKVYIIPLTRKCGCQQRIIVTTFASNVDRIQQIIDVAARYGRKVAVTGRSMENAMKVSTELGYMNIPDGVLVDLAHIKSLPKHKICIITTGSQGETMSALTRMAFNTHRQVEIQAGDRVILSASAIPGNENAIGSVINELYRKDAEVVNERLGALHVSGHACQEELKIIHALVKPKFFIPVHGEQRHLKTHAKLAQQMGMPPKNILISDIGKVIELTPNSAKINGTVPAGRVFVDGYGVGDVGSVVLRDRKHLAEDGMIVVVVSMSGEDGSVVSGPDIITRGFVYVKESEGLMEELRKVAVKALEECRMDTMNDWASIKSEIKNAISGFLYKKTKRNPMILPVIMEV